MSKVSMAQVLSEHRRGAILRSLSDSPEYTSNVSILTDTCKALGVTSTRDQVTGDLDWLADQGYVALDTSSANFYVATITQRGIEIAIGQAVVSGVKRPSPAE